MFQNFISGWEHNKIVESQDLINTDLNKSITSSHNNLSSSQQKDTIPQHHYHTRYLTHCLEQKQSDLDQQQHKEHDGSSTSHTSITKHNILLLNSDLSNCPITRLRYHQQLATQAKFSSNHSECDLDLDQIEND